MKRACYCKKPEGYEIMRLKAIRKNGTVEVEPIDEFCGKTYKNITDVVLSANLCGYGIIGDIERISLENEIRYRGENIMKVDDL